MQNKPHISYSSLLIAILGTVVEYYDYALYGFSALSVYFFPSSLSVENRLLSLFAIFAAGSCAKPIGAFIFGHIGDSKGRFAALKINMLGIALPTFFIGVMPTYAEVGFVAPCLLLLCRFMQGIFLGGEYDGVTIYVYEHAPKSKTCFANSCVYLAAMIGITFASWVVGISEDPRLPSWCWRLPFYLGGILGIGVFILRHFLHETPAFLHYQKYTPERSPASFKQLIKNQWRVFSLIILLCGTVGGTYHFYFIFLRSFVKDILAFFMPNEIHTIFSIALLLYASFGPIAGWIADKKGEAYVLKYATPLLGILAAFQIYCITQRLFPRELLWIISIVLAFVHIPISVILMKALNVGERYRLFSLGHTLGSALLSGTAPMIGMGLWQKSHMPVLPLYFGMALVLILFICQREFQRIQARNVQNKGWQHSPSY